MKTIITHVRPHIDDICALWLLKRYLPEYKDASIDFIPTDSSGGKIIDHPDFTYVGIGRGRFDEHKGDIGECASTLVFKFIRKEVKMTSLVRQATQKIVDWVLQEDTGKLLTVPSRQFTIPSIIHGEYDLKGKDSQAVARLGFAILDALFVSMKNIVLLDDIWDRRIEFNSRFGRAAAMETSARDVDAYAYSRGFDLVVQVNDRKDHHNIRARVGTPTNLKPVYLELKKREPEADWYLHHSNKLLICGGDITKDAHPSKMSLKDLVEILR